MTGRCIRFGQHVVSGGQLSCQAHDLPRDRPGRLAQAAVGIDHVADLDYLVAGVLKARIDQKGETWKRALASGDVERGKSVRQVIVSAILINLLNPKLSIFFL